MWGNRDGILAAQTDFARQNPNVIMELKTKSDNVQWLVENDLPTNLVVSWSLNPEAIIAHEELGTATLDRRLRAARALANKGCLVGFHFHPMVFYRDAAVAYSALADQVMALFSADEISFISFGALTFIRSALEAMRKARPDSPLLRSPLCDAAGKLSYPPDVKRQLFLGIYQAFAPWHDEVFFYLCMEDAALWRDVFGRVFNCNDDFELAFANAVLAKMTRE